MKIYLHPLRIDKRAMLATVEAKVKCVEYVWVMIECNNLACNPLICRRHIKRNTVTAAWRKSVIQIESIFTTPGLNTGQFGKGSAIDPSTTSTVSPRFEHGLGLRGPVHNSVKSIKELDLNYSYFPCVAAWSRLASRSPDQNCGETHPTVCSTL